MTTVRELMTPGVETVSPSQPLREAAQMMKAGDFGSMPVVEGDRLVGVLTDRDIVVRAVAAGLDTSSTRVSEVASREPVVVAADQDLDEALELMAEHRVRRLPVVDDGRLVGVVSRAVLQRRLAEDEEPPEPPLAA